MAKLENIIRYIVSAYPNRYELSIPRLVKILYLVDYGCASAGRRPITGLSWYNGYSGPDLRRVDEAERVQASYNQEMSREHLDHFYSHAGKLISRRREYLNPPLTELECLMIDGLIEQTYPLSWDRFISVILNTAPVRESSFSTWITLGPNEEGLLETVAK